MLDPELSCFYAIGMRCIVGLSDAKWRTSKQSNPPPQRVFVEILNLVSL